MVRTIPAAGRWWSVWRRFRKERLGVAGLVIVVFLLLVATLAPLLANDQPMLCRFDGSIYAPAVIDAVRNVPGASLIVQKRRPFRLATFDFKSEFDPERGDWAVWALVPFGPREIVAEPLLAPSRVHWLGTDQSGRDVLSRMIHGAGISMRVGFLSMGIAAVIGLLLGSIAGYAGKTTDIVISRFIEVVMCFPTFFLILAVLAWFPPKIENVMIVIGLTRWTGVARYARGEILRLRESDYVGGGEVARLLAGAHHPAPSAAQRDGADPGERDLRHRGLDPDRGGPVLARLRRAAARLVVGNHPARRL